MAPIEWFAYEGFGQRVAKEFGSAQSVRAGDRVMLSGQGGWDRITEVISTNRDEEIDAAFDNVEHAIKEAGATGFEQVYALRIFVTEWSDEGAARVAHNVQKHFPKHKPVLTYIGVARLYGTMTIEIEAEAYLGK